MSERDPIRATIASELETCTQHVKALIDQACSLSEREVLAAGDRIEDMRREAEGNLASLQGVGKQFESTSDNGRATLDAAMRRNAAVMTGYTHKFGASTDQQRACTAAVTEVARKITAFVAGVDRVSTELRMLTLNARLEAARWGNQGAAFATVASSMRELTGEVSKANEQIGGLADELSAIAECVASNEKTIRDLSNGLASDVTTQMAELASAYEATRRVSADAVATGVERGQRLVSLSNAMLTNLQFQDRLAQVLREAEAVVVRSEGVTGELLAAIPEGGSPSEVQATVDAILARAGKPVLRISGESELSSSDLALASGAVELF